MTGNRADYDLKASRGQMTLGMRLMGLSLLIAIVQIFLWLCEGHWTPCTIGELLRWTGATNPAAYLPGLQSIFDWDLEIPVIAGTAAIGFVIAWIGASPAEEAANAINAEN